MRCYSILAMLLFPAVLCAQVPSEAELPETAPLNITDELHVVMTRGMSDHARQELEQSAQLRQQNFKLDTSSLEAYEASKAPHRDQLRQIIGAVDPRVPHPQFQTIDDFLRPEVSLDSAFQRDVTWPVLDGVTGTGLQVGDSITGEPVANVIVLGDFAHTPEALLGLNKSLPPVRQFARRFVEQNCAVFVPALLGRGNEFSFHPDIKRTNLSHREYIYRLGHELGRHPLGYEVQKVLALVDVIEESALFDGTQNPLILFGVGDGGSVAMLAAALDPRIDACVVHGYFGPRESVWQEPIDRNVWKQLAMFGDAELAAMIAPRVLVVDRGEIPVVTGPPQAAEGVARIAAPGVSRRFTLAEFRREYVRAEAYYSRIKAQGSLYAVGLTEDSSPDSCIKTVMSALKLGAFQQPGEWTILDNDPEHERTFSFEAFREQQQVQELVRHTQMLLHRSDKVRNKLWEVGDRSSVDAWTKSAETYRNRVHDDLIGRLPKPTAPFNPRSRKVIDTETHVGYEVMLDVYTQSTSKAPQTNTATVIAGGILLIPRNLREGERRPVVVCQHGLEGTPMDTITTDKTQRPWGAYKGFSTQLVERGFIVYAPQNPYKGYDDFRVIQRQANPLGRSLFSYIIEQHRQTLNWLATLPYVDRDRIGFYGLSYGGKTAMRVPPLLPPTETDAGYCLSICSADFNEWIRKNASAEDRYSYVYTPEYEIWEWNMGHLAGYSELASLMAPRPFMVERGHDDGVAPDDWVGWEFARVRRHYDKLGLGDRTEIEWFNGPHTINAQGTFRFLHKQLNWPLPDQ
ncbi:MAG: hypothetical protein R3C01_17060 [Planctomycetaceae bacterium]